MYKPKLLFLGKLPPPYIGPSIATEIILKSSLKDNFELIHLDTSDHRDINTLGVFDFRNFYLAIKHYILLMILIIIRWPNIVYMPICQTSVGYFRDAGFILISKIFRRKVVCHLRGGNFKNWYDSTNFIVKYMIRRIHSIVDGQIVLGEKLRKLFKGILPERKIFVVPNGGDFNIRTTRKKHKNKIKIIYLSNFIRSKGILDVLKSITYVYSKFPQLEFVFVGDWIDDATKYEFNEFIKQNPNLPVILKNSVSGQAKYDLLTSSDIFVFPTYYPPEGHPWVLVEALATGLPIISTDHGAITESVINGVNGFIIEKKNPKQIAEKTRFLIDNPAVKEEMGEKSRRLYLENFTEKKMIERLSKVLLYTLKN